MNSSIDTLRKMAEALGAEISIMRKITLSEPSYQVAEILVQQRPNDDESQQLTDIRVVLVGGLGAGKSTLLGHISHGIKDNGRGRARLNLLRHRHELESGRSSSIAHEIIGYDSEGQLINYATTNVSTWEQICESSSKIVTFLDTCGYPKYLRTTISGLMGYAPDYACLVIAGNAGGITDMTKEHLYIAVMLGVPVFVVITKSDLATQDQLRSTLSSLLTILKSRWMSKIPVVVQTVNDLIACAAHFSRRGPELPIFMVSNVTGLNMNFLLKFFNHLPKPITLNYDELLEEPAEFQIEEVYSVSQVGIVVGGVLAQGRINIRDSRQYHLGPNSQGEFAKVKVISIHRHRVSGLYVHCGQTATLALDGLNENNWKIHKGMALLETETPQCYTEFEADVMVLFHATGVTKGTCGMINCGSIRQHARVTSVTTMVDKFDQLNTSLNDLALNQEESDLNRNQDDLTLLSGTQGKCIFKFMYEPCYMKIGAQILFMQGKSKCIGHVTRLISRDALT
ncbi:P-loop containing nucleoside triphosphate hydrolase protein [Helicostylum pulchrum]|nr:P-loop containing nucleoside triphosphate hydrolase protein [Helicostylum pulchrum]